MKIDKNYFFNCQKHRENIPVILVRKVLSMFSSYSNAHEKPKKIHILTGGSRGAIQATASRQT